MKKNQLVTTKSTALVLGKTKSLMGITKRLLDGSKKGLAKAKPSQDLTTHKDITLIGELMWEEESREMTWHKGMEYAKNLRLGGYDDWRLPTKEELGAVVTLCGGELATSGYGGDNNDDWSKKSGRNEANATYQTNYEAKGFVSSIYWSSSTIVGYGGDAWYVNFCLGNNYWFTKSPSFYVRCVRAGQ